MALIFVMSTQNPAQWFNPASDRIEAGGIGVVFSRLSTAQRTALSLAAADAGLFTYDTQLNQLFAWNGSFSAQMAALNSAGGLSVVAPIAVATGIITTNNPGFQLTEQWNSGGVTFTGWFTNITDTASAVGSLFADFQLNSVSKFSIRKDGTITNWNGVSSSAGFTIASTTGAVNIVSASDITLTANGAGPSIKAANGNLQPNSSTNVALTNNFICITTTAGAPTGTPGGALGNSTPIHFDNTGKKLYVRDPIAANWKSTVALT